MAWLNRDQINKLGFAKVGKGVKLSDKSSYYNCPNIEIGDHVRIDNFCVLSARQEGMTLMSK